ncbi:MAG: hypothetical protein ACYTFQ_12670, partial [Planctomycetota bacterium]
MKRLALALLLLSSTALATVTTSTRALTFSPTSATSVFTITYPFLDKDDLVVVRTVVATSTPTTLTRGTHYAVTLPSGSTRGYVTLSNPITSTHTLTVTRTVPLTQETSFVTSGSYNPQATEDALDKLTMIAQQVQAAAGTSSQTAVDTHEAASDPHTQYLLLAGRSGGQTASGGTTAGDSLTLQSTSHATKGSIIIGTAGTIAFDDVNSRLGVGTVTPSVALDVVGSAVVSGDVTVPTVYGSTSSGDDLTLTPNSAAANGSVLVGTKFEFDEANGRLAVNTTTPSYTLEVNGDAQIGTNLLLTTTGDIELTVQDDVLNISGDTTTAGSGAAGVAIYGSSHASLPDDLYLYSDKLVVSSETGAALATFNPATSQVLVDGQLSYRNRTLDPTVQSYPIDEDTDCGAVFFAS